MSGYVLALTSYERLVKSTFDYSKESDAVAKPKNSEKPKFGLSQILLLAMTPILVLVAIPLNVFVGRAAALILVAIALPLIIVAVLLLSRAEKKRWAQHD
ncbi:hypothetical protein ACX80U_16450 [Arthrobacter sp. TmT3-37]